VLFTVFYVVKREWYGYHFPELIKIVSDNSMYARVVKITKNRKDMTDELVSEIEEVVMDSSKAAAVIEAAKHSMGRLFVSCRLFNKLRNDYRGVNYRHGHFTDRFD